MPLTTVEKVKIYLNLSSTNDDEFIEDLIGFIQEQVEKYCNRKFDVATYIEDYQCKHKCFPKNTPLKSVQSIVRDNNIMMNADDYKIRGNYIEFVSDLKGYSMGGSVLYASDDTNEVTITYTAGYDTIPEDLKLAAIKLVALEYKKSREERLGVESEREGAVQRAYEKKDSEMPLDIEKVLIRYKKVSL